MIPLLLSLSLLLGQMQTVLAQMPSDTQLGQIVAENPVFAPNLAIVAYSPSQEERIKGTIRYWASFYGVNEVLAQDLAGYESGFNPHAKNPNSTAKGLFQFLNGTWKTHCEGEVTNPDNNAKCAMRLISEGGISHWTADRFTRNFLLSKEYVSCYNSCRLK